MFPSKVSPVSCSVIDLNKTTNVERARLPVPVHSRKTDAFSVTEEQTDIRVLIRVNVFRMGNFRNKFCSASPIFLALLFLQVLITSLGGSSGELTGKIERNFDGPQEKYTGVKTAGGGSLLTTQNLQSEFEKFRKLLKDELLTTFSEKFEQIQGLEEKVKTLKSQVDLQQKQIEMKDAVIDGQDKDIKRLQDVIDSSSGNKDKDDELTWLKNSFLKNPEWDTELHLAVISQVEDAVKLLVNNGAYINARNKELETPLYKASYSSIPGSVRIRMISFLIDNGANVYLKDSGNRTFLHNLVADGTSLTSSQFHEIVEYLISKNLSSLFNIPGWSSGINPFQAAVKHIQVESRTLSLLHKNGVDFNVLDRDQGYTVLAYAVYGKRKLKLVSDLIGFGVDWRSLDIHQRSLLHHAAAGAWHVDGLTYFLTNLGLNVNALDSWGNTPLHLTMLFGKDNVWETVRVLVENGTDLKIKNSAGRTPLEEALQRNDLPDMEKVVKLLKDKRT